jgi:hypothetical protein
MADEIRRLLENGSDIIVRSWSDKVISDRRVHSESQLTYLQLIDHIPQIVEELHHTLRSDAPNIERVEKGREHGRQRWRQGYELKEVIRELMLLRTTLMEFIETYSSAMRPQSAEQLTRAYRMINGFMDEELYKTVEAYLEAPREPRSVEDVAA